MKHAERTLRALIAFLVLLALSTSLEATPRGAFITAENGNSDAGHNTLDYVSAELLGVDNSSRQDADYGGATNANARSIITVTNTLDGTNPAPYGSLRWAVEQANASPGPDVIEFASFLSGTIILQATLSITDNSTTIDGSTASGGRHSIVLDGSTSAVGIEISSDYNVIDGLTIVNAFVAGIIVFDAHYNDIRNNYLGMMPDGVTPGPNQFGVWIYGDGDPGPSDCGDNLIGTNGPNVASGNTHAGIFCKWSERDDISNNYVGVGADGITPVPNTHPSNWGGISVTRSSSTLIHNNVISNNTGLGLHLYELTDVTVSGNMIGTDFTGSEITAPQQNYGIYAWGTVTGVIGGTLPGELNVICGNNTGIYLTDESEGLHIVGNFIGVGADGFATLPNGFGLEIESTVGTTIGGLAPAEGNFIFNNTVGVHTSDCREVSIVGNQIANNKGTTASAGVLLEQSVTCVIARNSIVGNQTGIRLSCPEGPTDCNSNIIIDNVVYDNVDYEIDLDEINSANDGITTPHVLVWYDDVQGYCATVTGGWACPEYGEVRLYRARAWDGIDGTHPSGYGGSISFDPLCVASCSGGGFTVSGLDLTYKTKREYDILTALAVDGAGNSSEFSANIEIKPGVIAGLSPILLKVYDPQGDSVGMGFSSMPNAIYDSLSDANGDGKPDEQIILSAQPVGDYQIMVFPDGTSKDGDTFTLLYTTGDDTTVIVQDVAVPPPGDSAVFYYEIGGRCCGAFTGGFTGNTDCDNEGKMNLQDVTRLIDRIYLSQTPLCCEENGDTNGDGAMNLQDVTRLIDHIYLSKNPTAACN